MTHACDSTHHSVLSQRPCRGGMLCLLCLRRAPLLRALLGLCKLLLLLLCMLPLPAALLGMLPSALRCVLPLLAVRLHVLRMLCCLSVACRQEV